MKPRVLIVDDDPARHDAIGRCLAFGYECHAAHTLDRAFAMIGRSTWEAALVDYDLGPNGSGIELLQALREISPPTLRLLYSDHLGEGLAHDAVRLGGAHLVADSRAPGFIAGLPEALTRLSLGPTPDLSESAPVDESGGDPVWFAESRAAKDFAWTLRAAAESDAPVFLYGERGTGKNVAALLLRRLRAAWRELEGREARTPASPVPAVLIAVPPLRERREDIPALAGHCLDRHAREARQPVRHLTNEALDDLLRRQWRGNVRELHGVLVRACQRAGPRLGLSVADLPRDAEPALQPSQSAKDDGQRECLLRQLRTAGNVSGAARLEGVTRTNYIRLMRRLGIIRADVARSTEPDVADPAPRSR